MKNLSPLEIAGLVLAVLLLLCFAPLPYGYYTFVRFCTMVVMGCFAYSFYKQQKMVLAVIAGSLALLFQPFFKIVLGREMWNVLDALLAIALVAYVLLHRKNKI